MSWPSRACACSGWAMRVAVAAGRSLRHAARWPLARWRESVAGGQSRRRAADVRYGEPLIRLHRVRLPHPWLLKEYDYAFDYAYV